MTFNDIFTILNEFSDEELENLEDDTLIEYHQTKQDD